MTDSSRLTSGSAWAFSGRIGALFFAFASSVMLARILTPEDFGAFFLVLTIARVAMLAGQVGMNQTVVRFVAARMASGQPDMARDTVIRAMLITLVGSCLVAVAYFFASPFLARKLFEAPAMAAAGGLVVIWIVAGSIRLLAAECFRGFHDLKMASLCELFVFELLFSVLVFILWRRRSVVLFQDAVSMAVLAAMVGAGIALWLLYRKISVMPTGGRADSRELLRTGWPLLVSNMVAVIVTHVGLWMVGAVSGVSDAARYATAFRLALLMQLPLLILNSVVPPLIAELHARRRNHDIEKTLRMIAAAEFIPTLVIYVFFLLSGRYLLTITFGAFYADGFLILNLLGAGILVNGWAGFCGPALMMTGNQHVLMMISLSCGLLALPVAFFLGGRFGAEGVAGGMALINGAQHFMMVAAVRRRLGIWTFVGNFDGLAAKVAGFAGQLRRRYGKY